MADAAAIRVQGLTKRFGRTEAVRGLDFSIDRNETVGLLGPNGAGKTTTIRMLAGFIAPTAGRIEIGGKAVDAASEAALAVRRRIGYLPEGTPLRRDMTVRSYLDARARLYGLARRRAERVQAAMERCGIDHRAGSLIGQLSKGLKQRVGLAQAILHEPEILILDEPSSGIDPVQVVEVRELIRELGRTHTIVFSSHVLSEAAQVCDRVLVMGRGLIVGERQGADGGSECIVIEAAAPVERLRELLVPFATGEIAAEPAGTLTCCRVPVTPGADPSTLAAAVVGAGIALHRLTRERDDLEAVFMRLFGDDGEAPANS